MAVITPTKYPSPLTQSFDVGLVVPNPTLPVLLDTRINSISLDWIVRAPLLPEGFPTKLHFISAVEDKSNLVVLPEVPEILNIGEFPETSKFVDGFVTPTPRLVET